MRVYWGNLGQKADEKQVPSELNQSTECADTHGPKAAQPDKLQSLVQSGTQSSVKSKLKSDRCRICQKFGHWARDCRSANSNNVNDSKMVTIRPLLTMICVENVAEVTFEVDTGASHSMISLNSYYKLQNDFVIKGRKPLRYQGKPLDILDIKLADGSTSFRFKGMVQLNIAKSVECKESKLVTFFVVQDGKNLLGRHTIQMLWPKAFNSFVRAIDATSKYKPFK